MMRRAFAVFLLSLLIASCDSVGSGEEVNGDPLRLTASTQSLPGPGSTVRISVEDGARGAITWQSDDESILSVDAQGVVTAEGFGSTSVEAVSGNRTGRLRIDVVAPFNLEIQNAPVAFVNVHVVTMSSEVVLERQTVLVRDKRIERIGPSASVQVPGAYDVIEANRDQPWYLMPGLADMHIHMVGANNLPNDNDMTLYVANGVTTVREMWGQGASLRQKQRNAIDLLGPTVYAASPGLDGPGGPWAAATPPIGSPEQARQTVAQHVAAGYDFIKVYNLLAPEVYDAIVDEAAIHGIKVIGHVPSQVPLERAVEAGQYSMEHLIGYGRLASTAGSRYSGSIIQNVADQWANTFREAGVFHTPTLTVDLLTTGEVTEIRNGPTYKYLSTPMRNSFENGFHKGITAAQRTAAEVVQRALTQTLVRNGVKVLLGTDAGFGFMVPGFTAHDELKHFVDAGLTPYEALQTATTNPAAFFEAEDDFGRIEEGLRADMILVYGNPLQDVSRASRRIGVMLRGRWLSEPRLAELIDEIRIANGN